NKALVFPCSMIVDYDRKKFHPKIVVMFVLLSSYSQLPWQLGEGFRQFRQVNLDSTRYRVNRIVLKHRCFSPFLEHSMSRVQDQASDERPFPYWCLSPVQLSA